MPNDFSLGVQNIERYLVSGLGLEVIIDHCAGRRIIADWLVPIEFSWVMQSQRSLGLIQKRIADRGLRIDLTQRRHIIQHPKGTSMGSGNQIVILNHQVMNRRRRQIQLQWLPMGAVIE